MKLTLIFLAFFTAAVYATEPLVVVSSATEVTVDGLPFGKPADVIANHPELAAAVQRALEAWSVAVVKDRADAKAEMVAKNARIQSVLQGMLQEELATGEGPKTQLLRRLLVEAAKPEEVLRKEALEAEIAAKQAELNKLNN